MMAKQSSNWQGVAYKVKITSFDGDFDWDKIMVNKHAECG